MGFHLVGDILQIFESADIGPLEFRHLNSENASNISLIYSASMIKHVIVFMGSIENNILILLDI